MRVAPPSIACLVFCLINGLSNSPRIPVRQEIVLLTSQPTSGPTSGPTSPPTSAPTFVPTSSPTNGPTSGPTSGPTPNKMVHTETKNCTCVACMSDKLCGGLWKGTQDFGGSDANNNGKTSTEIHVVVSHCMVGLEHVMNYLKGYRIASFHVISKCGKPVTSAPTFATIQNLTNVGRCDHSYVHYISNTLDKKLKQVRKGNEKDAIVVFLKDNFGSENIHQPGVRSSFKQIARLASSQTGFGCAITPKLLWQRFSMSAYFEYETMKLFNMSEYERLDANKMKYNLSDAVNFKSSYKNLGDFYDSLEGAPKPQKLVQFCMGGGFAASVQNIKSINSTTWKALEERLSRGDNIQEGHFMERLWGLLLTTPLQPYQERALLDFADMQVGPRQTPGNRSNTRLSTLVTDPPLWGDLLKKPEFNRSRTRRTFLVSKNRIQKKRRRRKK